MCATPPLPSPAIGTSLAAFRRVYGPEIETCSPATALYPKAHVFRSGALSLVATAAQGTVVRLGVFFDVVPNESIEALLQTHSDETRWEKMAGSDPAVARHFPLFAPHDPTNAFYRDGPVFALVQHNVGFGPLVIWLQHEAWLEALRRHRSGGATIEALPADTKKTAQIALRRPTHMAKQNSIRSFRGQSQ